MMKNYHEKGLDLGLSCMMFGLYNMYLLITEQLRYKPYTDFENVFGSKHRSKKIYGTLGTNGIITWRNLSLTLDLG